MEIQLLSHKIDVAIQLIDMFEEILVSGIEITKEEMIHALGNSVLDLFPDIVESYSLPQLNNMEDETYFWMTQLERNIEAIEKADIFCVIDTLIIETRQAMVKYQKELQFLIGEVIYG